MASEIQKLRSEKKNEIYIMREDLLPFSMGGNKVRIAGAFFRDMQEKNCDAMLIYGEKHSNLCRVLSNLCCSRGIFCVMICSHGENEEEKVTNNTRFIEWSGTEIVHCKKTEIAETVEAQMNRLREMGKKPYYIYGDKTGRGNEGTAAAAYAEAYEEIREFEKKIGWEFDYIFLPSGPGATQSGLLCGHFQAEDKKKIMGIMISSREKERMFSIIQEGIEEYHKKSGRGLKTDYEKEIFLLDEYRIGGYGLYDERVKECIRRQYRTNGIPLDPVYTGKAFRGMEEYIKENHIKNSRILFLHTGGTPLFYDFLQKEEESCKC